MKTFTILDYEDTGDFPYRAETIQEAMEQNFSDVLSEIPQEDFPITRRFHCDGSDYILHARARNDYFNNIVQLKSGLPIRSKINRSFGCNKLLILQN